MATSYDNPGGSGDRRAIITVSCVYTGDPLMNTDTPTVFIDGSMNNANWFNNTPVAGKAVRFDFGSSKIIDEATFYQSLTTEHGVWRWQGSANASDWNNIGGTLTLGGSAAQVQTSLNGNTADYRYWQLLGVSGNGSNAPFMREWTFKIGDPAPPEPIITEITTPAGSLLLTGYAPSLYVGPPPDPLGRGMCALPIRSTRTPPFDILAMPSERKGT